MPSDTIECLLHTGRNDCIAFCEQVPDPIMNGHRIRLKSWILVGVVIAAGWYMRMDQFQLWQETPARYFYSVEGERRPLMMNTDGYYYLDLAQDLIAGTYSAWDADRFVPQGDWLPPLPPLLSTISAGLSRLLGLSLDWVGAFLPPLLGVLLAVPVFLLGRRLGGNLVGILAAWFALLSPHYAFRTGFAWFDTDMLNVTLATFCAWLALEHGLAEGGRRRAAYFGAWLVALSVYFWWWDQSPQAVVGLGFLPLLMSWVFLRRPRGREFALYGMGLSLFAVGTLMFAHDKGSIFDVTRWVEVFDYLSGEKESIFPAGAGVVSEQQDVAWSDSARRAAGHWWVFLLGLGGLLGAVVRGPRRASVLAGLILVAGMAPLAIRFTAFVAPLVGLGLGYFVGRIHAALSGGRRSPILSSALLVLVVLGLSWPGWSELDRDNARTPRWLPHHIEAMQAIARNTPENALVWTSWDHGNLVQYFARRATIADGRRHGGYVTYAMDVPLVVETPRLAANWMEFYAARGIAGIEQVIQEVGQGPGEGMKFLQRILKAGPEDAATILDILGYVPEDRVDAAVEFFFPPRSRPIYLLLDDFWTVYSWLRVGSWDFTAGDDPPQLYRLYAGVSELEASGRVEGHGRFDPSETIRIDLARGGFQISRKGTSVSGRLVQVVVLDRPGGEERVVYSGPDREGRFEYSAFSGVGVLMNRHTQPTMMNRLYLHRDQGGGYFESVIDRAPDYRVWSVGGDAPRTNGDGA